MADKLIWILKAALCVLKWLKYLFLFNSVITRPDPVSFRIQPERFIQVKSVFPTQWFIANFLKPVDEYWSVLKKLILASYE